MDTEHKIIYGILETLRNSEYNNDEVMSERYLRALLQTFRGKDLRIYYNDGHTISDEVFQTKKILFKSAAYTGKTTQNIGTDEYISEFPKIIQLNGYGFYMEVYGVPIPIVPSHEYSLLKHDKFQKKLIFAKTENQKVYIYAPHSVECINSGDNKALRDYIFAPANGTGANRKFNINFHGVFHDPEDADGYDWEINPWPFPSERLDDFITNLLRRQFGIMVNVKSDEIQNNRQDNIRYHDNTDVNKT